MLARSGAPETLRRCRSAFEGTGQSALELNPSAMCGQHVRAGVHPETHTANVGQLCYVQTMHQSKTMGSTSQSTEPQEASSKKRGLIPSTGSSTGRIRGTGNGRQRLRRKKGNIPSVASRPGWSFITGCLSAPSVGLGLPVLR